MRHLRTIANELGIGCEKWLLALLVLDIQILDVGCTNPQKMLHGLRVGRVGDVCEHYLN